MSNPATCSYCGMTANHGGVEEACPACGTEYAVLAEAKRAIEAVPKLMGYVHSNAGDNWAPRARCGEELTVSYVGVSPGQHCVSNNPDLVSCPTCRGEA